MDGKQQITNIANSDLAGLEAQNGQINGKSGPRQAMTQNRKSGFEYTYHRA